MLSVIAHPLINVSTTDISFDVEMFVAILSAIYIKIN
jgi:hypothetical protein